MGIIHNFILFTLALFVCGSAHANAPPPNPNELHNKTWCNEKIPFSSLTYMGSPFQPPYECLKAYSDSEAKSKNYNYFINPANPVYHGTGAKEGATDSKNPDGFYYVVFGEPHNRKYHMCQVLAPLLDDKDGRPRLRYDYRTSGPYGDGKCYCGTSPSNMVDCSMGIPTSLAASVEPSRCSGNLKPAATPTGRAGLYCGCTNNTAGEYPVDVAEERCAAQVVVQGPVNPSDPSTPSAPVAAIPPNLDQCLSDWLETSALCKTQAVEAKNRCDEKNRENEPTNAVANITGAMGGIYAASRQASGSQAECFQAGVAANAGRTAIRGMQTTCEADFETCNNSCGENKVEEFQRDCARRSGRTIQDLQSDQAFSQKSEEIETNFTDGRRICAVDAKNNKDTLSNLMSGIGQALQASTQCACELSSAGGDCKGIPTPAQCDQIPQPAGCGPYGAMETCTPGSPAYNAKSCGCAQNPRSPGCSGNSANAVSSFAGPPIAGNLAAAAPGGVNFGGSGGARASGLTLGGANNEVDSDLSFLGNGKSSSGGAAAANSVGAAGAAGGGAAPNGNINGEKGSMPLEEEGGLGGMFKQAKTFMANTLGLAKKPAAKDSSKGTLAKPSMDKFKPLRGLASKSNGMGSRNMDIWKMMNSCLSGTTCKSNEGNFLTAP